MDGSCVQTNEKQLAVANIQDYLEDKVGLDVYRKRKELCESLLHKKLNQTQSQINGMVSQAMTTEQALGRNSQTDLAAILLTQNLVDEAASMSPGSVDSAYSSSPPSSPSYYSQDAIYRPPPQDNSFEETTRLLHSVSPGPPLEQRACPGVERESSKRQATRPLVRHSNKRKIAVDREAADTDEPDPERPPKKKRNRGPKPRVMYKGKGPMQLWQLILQLLVSSSPPDMAGLVEWTREEKYGFKIVQPEKLAKLWGELKKKPAMNFDKLSRSLRYYYDKSMLRKVAGKENTYQFTWDISEIVGYDPVRASPVSDTAKSERTSPFHSLVDRSSVQDPVNELTVSNPVDDLLVCTSIGLSDSHSVDVPVSRPQNEVPVFNHMEEFGFPIQGLWTPFLDPEEWLPVSDRLIGVPVASYPVGGSPVPVEPSPMPPPTPLDFTVLVESDQKSNFYEVL